MGAQLNIKDEVLIQRARDLASSKGEPVTAMLRKLVDEAWTKREQERAERLRAMQEWAREVQATLPPELRGMTSKEIMDSIYDDDEPDGFAR